MNVVHPSRTVRLLAIWSGLLVFTVGCKPSETPDQNGSSSTVSTNNSTAASGSEEPTPGSCTHVTVGPRCHDDYCLIPAGCFVMGSPLDEPYRGMYTEFQHEVTLTNAFIMQGHELTQGEWEAFGYPNLAGTMDDGDGGTDCVAKDCPASTMTWFEAVEYANKLSEKQGLSQCIELEGCTGAVGVDFRCTGYHQTTPSYYECLGYRLPTQAEFEYAMRAGTTTAFYSGPFEPASTDCVEVPHLNDTAWYCTNSGKRTHPVKNKKPNPWGLHDMMGNVMEYVASNPDLFELEPQPVANPFNQLSADGTFGMFGGPFFGWPAILRSAAQLGSIDVIHLARDKSMGAALGFRLVRTLSAEEAARW